MKTPKRTIEQIFSVDGQLPSDIRRLCLRCPVVYDASTKNFWVRDIRNTWIPVTETAMRRHVQQKLHMEKLLDTGMYIQKIQEWLTVDLSLELSGHMAGVYDWSKTRNMRVLVTKSPILIEPREGKWPIIRQLLRNMLDDQTEHCLSWCKLTDHALRTGILDKLQSLVLCGPANGGKSRFQNWIVTPLCGNREVLCYKYIGKEFTAHLFNAEHHKIEDEVFSKDWYHQNVLRQYIKNVAANDTLDWHRKFGTPVALPIFRRLTLSCNDTEEDLRILPPLDVPMMDKLSLYYCRTTPMPMATNTLEQRKRFEQTVKNELPAFVHFLQHWKIPDDLVGGRDGLQCIHHPKVLELCRLASPELSLFEIVSLFLKSFRRPNVVVWKGTSTELHREILMTLPECREMLHKLCSHSTAFAGLLAKLFDRDKAKTAINRRLLDGYNVYEINVKGFISGKFLE